MDRFKIIYDGAAAAEDDDIADITKNIISVNATLSIVSEAIATTYQPG